MFIEYDKFDLFTICYTCEYHFNCYILATINASPVYGLYHIGGGRETNDI